MNTESNQEIAPLRTVALLVYALQAASLFVGLTLIIGIVVNYVKRGAAKGTWLESHFTWQISTFWLLLLWTLFVATTAALAPIVGILVAVAGLVWFIYRFVRGWLYLNENKELPGTKLSLALLPLGGFVLLVALFGWGLDKDPSLVPSPLVGKPAPAFLLESLKDPGKQIGSDVLKGKVSLVNVWASWCPSCREEHAELVRIGRESKVQMIGLNWKDERPAALEMLRQFGNPYQLILFDPDNRAGIDWGVYGAPETFVVDPEGIIRHKRVGPIDEKVWKTEILPVIQKYAPKG